MVNRKQNAGGNFFARKEVSSMTIIIYLRGVQP
mgnify:CR=1 FL=1